MRSFIVLAALLVAAPSFAGETKLGTVVAIEQSVTVDLAACEAAWKQGAEYGFCEITDAAIAANAADLASLGNNDMSKQSTAVINLANYRVEVGFQMGKGAYYVYALKVDEKNTVSAMEYANAKSHLEAALTELAGAELKRTLLRYE